MDIRKLSSQLTTRNKYNMEIDSVPRIRMRSLIGSSLLNLQLVQPNLIFFFSFFFFLEGKGNTSLFHLANYSYIGAALYLIKFILNTRVVLENNLFLTVFFTTLLPISPIRTFDRRTHRLNCKCKISV